jgi:hypothetical protein
MIRNADARGVRIRRRLRKRRDSEASGRSRFRPPVADAANLRSLTFAARQGVFHLPGWFAAPALAIIPVSFAPEFFRRVGGNDAQGNL